MLEYNAELSTGDPIMKVAEFTLPSAEERAARRAQLEAELNAVASGETVDAPVEASTEDELPSAPDLDALADNAEGSGDDAGDANED